MKAFVALSFLAMVSVAGCGSSDTKLAEQVATTDVKLSALQATVTDMTGKVGVLSKSLAASQKEVVDARTEIAKLSQQVKDSESTDHSGVLSCDSLEAKSIFLLGSDRQPLLTIATNQYGPFVELTSRNKSSTVRIICTDNHSSIIALHEKHGVILKAKADAGSFAIQNVDEKIPRFSATQNKSGEARMYFTDGTEDGEARSYP